MKMTKQEAMKLFRESHKKTLKEFRGDKVLVRTCWNDFTDYLMKDGLITEKQYNNWANPF